MTPGMRKALSIPLAVAAALLLAGAALLWWSNEARVRAGAELRSARQTLNASRDRYRQTVEEEQRIRDTIARFENLDAGGLIGSERRLDWADALRGTRQTLRLPALEFELEPQRLVGPLGTDGDKAFTLVGSTMRLHATLLHEGDLFELMAALRAPNSALVVPKSCSLAPGDARTTGAQGTLRAECTLDWLTLTPPAKAGDKP